MPDLQGMLSNPGLPMTAAAYSSLMVVAYTACERVECVVDGAPPGKHGRLFIVEPHKPTKIPFLAAKFMLEHLAYTGVVLVEEVETRDEEGNVTGIQYNVEAAHEESMAKGIEQDQMRWQRWVTDMVEDYVKRAKPVPPPPDTINRLIARRGYKMQEYGIKPIGFQDPIDEMNTKRDNENAMLKSQVSDLNSKIELLLRQNAMAQESKEKSSGTANGNDEVQDVPPANRAGTRRQPRSGR